MIEFLYACLTFVPASAKTANTVHYPNATNWLIPQQNLVGRMYATAPFKYYICCIEWTLRCEHQLQVTTSHKQKAHMIQRTFYYSPFGIELNIVLLGIELNFSTFVLGSLNIEP